MMPPAPPKYQSALFRLLGSRLAPKGPNAKLSILIFHRVLSEPDALVPGEITVEAFDAQLTWLKAVFNILPLSDAVARLKAGTLPSRAASITFDDGYADNVTLALPILQKHDLTATFFIATAYLNGGRMFNDTVIEAVRRSSLPILDLSELNLGQLDLGNTNAKIQVISKILSQVKYLHPDRREETVAHIAKLAGNNPLPDDLMMSTDQLRRLQAAGMEIGGHTHRHPILAKLNDTEAKKEIEQCKTWLEETLGNPIRLFAYPNGKPGTDYRPEQACIVKGVGFDAAVSTYPGVSVKTTDPYQLARFTPWDDTATAYSLRLLKNLTCVNNNTIS